MIVVDTNVIAYLYLPTEFTTLSEDLLKRDPDWTVPVLWRSELRSVLTLYLRKELLGFDRAYAIQAEAEGLLAGREHDVDSYAVLRLAAESRCLAYDCEFVALANHLGTRLVTTDKQVLEAFPSVTLSLAQATRAAGSPPGT